MSAFTPTAAASVADRLDGELVSVEGVISEVETRVTGQSNPWASVIVGGLECVVFPGVYRRFARLLEVGAVVTVSGRTDLREPQPRLVAMNIAAQPDDDEFESFVWEFGDMRDPAQKVSGVAEAKAETQSVIARADTKAALLVGFDGVALAALWAVGRDIGLAGLPLAVAGLAGCLFLASIVALLLAVLPDLGDGQSGFPRWAQLSPEQVKQELSADSEAAHLVALSKIGVATMGTFRRADLLTLAGIGMAVAAGAIHVVLGVAR